MDKSKTSINMKRLGKKKHEILCGTWKIMYVCTTYTYTKDLRDMLLSGK